MPKSRHHCRLSSASAASLLSRGVRKKPIFVRSDGSGNRGPCVVELNETSASVFAAWRSANTCASMPPIDPPMMTARAMPSASSSAAASSAMSPREYGAVTSPRLRGRKKVGTADAAHPSKWELWPVSRLSTHTTRNGPAAARASTKSGWYISMFELRPHSSSTTGAVASAPTTRYATSTGRWVDGHTRTFAAKSCSLGFQSHALRRMLHEEIRGQ
mmetsp:Transcript_796/g.2755  ORF Transcript_796/g.2755 Transcript_796/m.2755 type:complete len:216 (-) Transcript_796:16-663(-)